ncbi:MAG: N-formylglutamate amidohydrolase [Nitrospinaceae bacterium]|nr:N-formylglutamate amidohydrolase [Nitrospinaceae bacterium]NIR54192.1 N-formylglutamate amidohydrolase [Nitrospinaceae bacterium]NIS84607.1 N-formylglutamate amidohydrolase [Nitrospinaceae bacterium]NIT81402.1 N-formylglutamate amidohydrolase [Nitrospinaceae bacterium]NIU43686.1 N-formylglutamate amidohydrolase [Nitrospinaceae bacterium]
MEEKLPVLLSIPHGGTRIPSLISDFLMISQRDRFEDGDAFTREIYGLKDDVWVQVEGEVARAVVDLNRAPEDRPPANPDGVVKTQTCHGARVYLPGREPDEQMTERLLADYHQPFHRSIQEALDQNPELALALDCHSMEPVGPGIAPDPGQTRPRFCLGTRNGSTCPPETAHRLAACLREAFNLEEEDVVMNQPFAGGYITRKYGDGRVPWVQIEMNRNLYLSPPWFDAESLTVQPERLRTLNRAFRQALISFFRS